LDQAHAQAKEVLDARIEAISKKAHLKP